MEKENGDSKIKVYLAAGFFNPEQIKIVDFVEAACMMRENIELFSPRKSSLVPPGSIADKSFRSATFNSNVQEVEKADCIISSTAGKDMGTIFESGYAYKCGKPIFYIYLTDNPLGFNLMLSESSKGVITKEADMLELLDILNTEGLNSEKLKKFEYGGKVE